MGVKSALLSPDRTTVERWAWASVVANTLIVLTGGLVRLTGSGLGCPTWPRCTDESFVPHRAQDLALVLQIHVFDDRDGVIGIQFGGEIGDLLVAESFQHLFADPVVHLRQGVAVEHLRQHPGERLTLIGGGQFEQIGNVGGMERLDQRACATSSASTCAMTASTKSDVSRSSSSCEGSALMGSAKARSPCSALSGSRSLIQPPATLLPA